MSIDCFSREGQKYDLVPDHDPRDAAEGNLQANGGGAMRGVRREVRWDVLPLPETGCEGTD